MKPPALLGSAYGGEGENQAKNRVFDCYQITTQLGD
jgi:hypothetical protein